MIVQCHITGKYFVPAEEQLVDDFGGMQFRCRWCDVNGKIRDVDADFDEKRGQWHGWQKPAVLVVPARVLGLAWLRTLWGQKRRAA